MNAKLMGIAVFAAVGAILLGLWLGGVFDKPAEYVKVTISLEKDGVFLKSTKTLSKETFVVVPDFSGFQPQYSADTDDPFSLVKRDFSTATKTALYDCGNGYSDTESPTGKEKLMYQICKDQSSYTDRQETTGNIFMGVMHMDHVKAGDGETIVKEGLEIGTDTTTALFDDGPLLATPQSHTFPTCYPHRCVAFVPKIKKDTKKVTGFEHVFTGEDITGLIAEVGTSYAKYATGGSAPEAVKPRVAYLKSRFQLKDHDTKGKQLMFKGDTINSSGATSFAAPEDGLPIRPGKHFSGPEVLEAAFIRAVDTMEADVVSLKVDYKMEADSLSDMMYNLSGLHVNTSLGGGDGVGGSGP